MTQYVFVGPTLPEAEVRAACDAVCLPPAALGDVYRVAQKRPSAIGIIDGYFDGVPSVWHKEILWSMAEGIHVFGSASMGALRAAELHDFGMQGVGQIFEWYRDGTLEDDDEVAVLHGPQETGYVALSEPMVNIRASLNKARDRQIVTSTSHRRLMSLAKGLFYQERSWQAVFDAAEYESIPRSELAELRRWLQDEGIDLKRLDALKMLSAMQDLPAQDLGHRSVPYHFEWTEMWDDAVHFSAAARSGVEDGTGAVPQDLVLDEVKLDSEAFQRIRTAAVLRLLAQRESDRRRLPVDPAVLRDSASRFRMENRLLDRAALDRWLDENDLDQQAFERLMTDQARLNTLEALIEPALDQHLLAELRLSGDYPRLVERARAKHGMLAGLGFDDPDPQDVGVSILALRSWYFESRLGRAMPEDMDAFAQELGFANRTEFDRALLKEYLYSQDNEQRDRN